jgi:hypothetical protein
MHPQDSTTMSWYQHLTDLVDRLARGENGAARSEVVRLCEGFLWSVRIRFGFLDVPWTVVRNTMVDDALQTAIANHLERRRPFLQCLQNAFRDACRDYRRHKQRAILKTLDTDCQIDAVSIIAADSEGAGMPPAKRAARNETVRTVVTLLRQEDRLCQRMILMWLRGSTDTEIGQCLRLEAEECKGTRWRNIRRVQRRLPSM